MSKKLKNRIKDIATGIELTPEEPDACLGNGELGFECCCDECDYYWLYFPEFDTMSEEENASNGNDAEASELY